MDIEKEMQSMTREVENAPRNAEPVDTPEDRTSERMDRLMRDRVQLQEEIAESNRTIADLDRQMVALRERRAREMVRLDNLKTEHLSVAEAMRVIDSRWIMEGRG